MKPFNIFMRRDPKKKFKFICFVWYQIWGRFSMEIKYKIRYLIMVFKIWFDIYQKEKRWRPILSMQACEVRQSFDRTLSYIFGRFLIKFEETDQKNIREGLLVRFPYGLPTCTSGNLPMISNMFKDWLIILNKYALYGIWYSRNWDD